MKRSSPAIIPRRERSRSARTRSLAAFLPSLVLVFAGIFTRCLRAASASRLLGVACPLPVVGASTSGVGDWLDFDDLPNMMVQRSRSVSASRWAGQRKHSVKGRARPMGGIGIHGDLVDEIPVCQ